MSESEKFLERWSRLKRGAVPDTAPPSKTQSQNSNAEDKSDKVAAVPSSEVTKKDGAEVPFDVASLPCIDSIGAETDIRAFLRPGVPPDLTREALRRAWTADPQIRDFIGLVENGWDFNDPNAMHGFGPIDPRDVQALLERIVGPPEKREEQPRSAKTDDIRAPEGSSDSRHESAKADKSKDRPIADLVQRNEKNVATQDDSEAPLPSAKELDAS